MLKEIKDLKYYRGRNSYFIEHNLGKKTILEIAGEKKTDAEVLQVKSGFIFTTIWD